MSQKLIKKLQSAINLCSAENESNTPDFILAEFLAGCLEAFNKAIQAREKWYGIKSEPGLETWNQSNHQSF